MTRFILMPEELDMHMLRTVEQDCQGSVFRDLDDEDLADIYRAFVRGRPPAPQFTLTQDTKIEYKREEKTQG